MSKIVLHIDVAKVTGEYTNVLAVKDALSTADVPNPEVPVRLEAIEYGNGQNSKIAHIPIFSENIEQVLGADWKELDIITNCPAGSITCGDIDDPNSEVSKIKAKGDFETLPAEYGSSAADVYYSNLPKRQLCGEVVFSTDQNAAAEGVEVSLESSKGKESLTTDAFGAFEFKKLDFDTSYALKLSAPGFVTKEIAIEAGSHVDLGLVVLEAE